MPSGGIPIPGEPGVPGGSSGEQTAGNEQGDSDQNQEGAQNGEDPGNDGWDTSNQIPGQEEGNQSASDESGGEGHGNSQGTEDGELGGAFEDFDGTILAERELILARANENAGSRDREAEEPLPEIPGSADGSDSGDTGQAPGGNIPLPPRSGTPTQNTGVANLPVGDLPKDLPDARDDDILARQLREAAMSEPDPELREKLWTEYRRYKKGL